MGAPTVTPIQENRHAGGYMVWDPSDGMLTSQQISLASGAGQCTAGLVLGRVSGAVAAAGANTGNGTFGNIAQLPGAREGAYAAVCTQATTGTPASTVVPHEGNVGTGVLTVAAVAAPAVLGAYRVELLATGGTAAFDVFTPAGVLVGSGNVATAFVGGGLSFTLANAGTMTKGDGWDIIVTDDGIALFSLTDPAGDVLPNITVGSVYNHALDFTLSQGVTKFVVGDSFTITVSAAAAVYQAYDPTANNGLQYAAAILWSGFKDATSAAKKAAATVRGPCRVNSNELIWGANVTTAAQQTAALATLAKLGILAT